MLNNYYPICYHSKDDNAYIAFLPDLPGCFADGKSVSRAMENLSVVADEWIETAEEDGRPIPSPLVSLDTSDPTVFDVAKYILSKTGTISTMMLQKLVYYSQAWALAWFGQPLFTQDFQAWRKGPVCKELYDLHSGQAVISSDQIHSDHCLSGSEKHLIDNVLSVYKDEDPTWLSKLTHEESPWRDARHNLSPNAISREIIPKQSIMDFYSSLITT